MRTEPTRPVMMVHLNTIGPVSIEVGSTRFTTTSQQVCATLLYLVVERGKEIPRRALGEMFFPDATEVAGKHPLRQLLYRLRKRGVDIDRDSPTVMLPRDGATWDLELADSRGHCTDDELDHLANGYLPAFSPTDSPAFNEWLERHRASALTTLRRILVGQLREEKSKHRFTTVDRVARALLALDPLNEEATLASAEVLVMSGSKTEALSVLDRYIDEVGPRSRDLRFAPKLLRERISEYVVDSGLLAEPPLVGRDEEIATLRALLSRVGRGDAEACVVWGASGIGKTRLLNETCAIAALEGVAVVRCALQPHDQRRPLAVLRDVVPRLLDLPGALGCSPDSLALMRGLCGRGPMPERQIPRSTQDSEVALASVLAAATDLLDAVCSERSVLLCIEDAHWLDAASLELIVEAVAGQRPLCVLIASQRSLQLPSSLADASRLNSIEVTRLSKEMSIDLLHRLFARSARRVDDEFVEWATALADGVPFYLQSLFIEYANTGDRTAIPSTLTASLASKLDRLGEPTRSVFDAIVVLGKLCTVARLEALVQLPRHALIVSLRELEERGLIRPGQRALTFAHELFAVTARNRMPSSVSKTLHRAAAEALEEEIAAGNAEPWDVAAHWQESGDAARGLSVMQLCANESLAMGRPQEALSILSRAADLSIAPVARTALLKDTLRAAVASGETRRAYQAARELVDRHSEAAIELPLDLELTFIEMTYNAAQDTSRFTQRLRSIAIDQTSDSAYRIRAANRLLMLADDANDFLLAQAAIRSIDDIPATVPACRMPRLIFHTIFGDWQIAVPLAMDMVKEVSAVEDRDVRRRDYFNAGMAFFRCGLFERAVSALIESHDAAKEARVWSAASLAAAHTANMFLEADNVAAARQWHLRSAELLSRSSFPDRSMQHHFVGFRLALLDGCTDDAETILSRLIALFPTISLGRPGITTLSLRVQLALARGLLPRLEDVELLLGGYLNCRSAGQHDGTVDTLVAALNRLGRDSEAANLRAEYLTVWRREQSPPSKIFRSLHTPEGTATVATQPASATPVTSRSNA